ncbi:gap junction delta-4 protein-like [Odontesthes bonariensis]|uniref:gap junction delta-4 protein-like n=1 Tax=Odontesthes bonariensis TaxID=219752 RepID=UPI003F58F538
MGPIDLFFITICHNVSFVGKIWWILMLLSRLLVLLLAGFTLFGDEQERFICNTIQPGCSNVCFDAFAPISVLRLWLIHLILLSLAHLMFATYVMHKVWSFSYFQGFCCDGSRRGSPFTLENSSREALVHKAPLHELPREWGVPRFYCAHLLVVILQMLLEAICCAGQFYLFGMTVPKSFLCYEAPCTSGVECYISRPTEKTLMLNFMLVVASLSVLLSLADFVSSVKGIVSWRRKGDKLMEEISKGEQSSMLTTTTVTEDTDTLLVQRISPAVSSKVNGLKDKRCAIELNDELLNTKMNGGQALKTWKSANEGSKESKDGRMDGSPPPSSISSSVPSQLNPPVPQRKTTAMGFKKLGQYTPFGKNSGQPSGSLPQDKRAWV